jgi:hypothetical protein
MFYNAYLPMYFLHDYKTDVKLDEDSNSLIQDDQLSSIGIILILYNIPYDNESIPQCLQENDYIRDYVRDLTSLTPHVGRIIYFHVIKTIINKA